MALIKPLVFTPLIKQVIINQIAIDLLCRNLDI